MALKTKPFDPAAYLDSDEAIAEYLTAVMDGGDAATVAAALGDVARARGMTQIAKDAGITREALYKALRPDSQPRLDTILRVCSALGLRITVHPT